MSSASRRRLSCASALKKVVLMVLILAPVSARAIIVRHDRPDSLYLALGEEQTALGTFLPPGNGAATLIAPRWALTAAHVTKRLTPFTMTIQFGSESYRIEQVYLHPGYEHDNVDMALLELAEPVRGMQRARPYNKSDEVGKEVTLAGWGDTGTGLTGPARSDGRLRGATNLIADVLDDSWITFTFGRPPEATALEGISGPGDSGGPALLHQGDEVWILGVSSFQDIATGEGPGRYGVSEHYTRVSSNLTWIEETLAGRGSEPMVMGEVHELSSSGWPESRAAEVASAYFEAYAGSDDEALFFEQRFRSARGLARRSAPDRVLGWRERRGGYGELSPRNYASLTDGAAVLARSGESEWLLFRFRLDDESRLAAMMVIPIEPSAVPPRIRR